MTRLRLKCIFLPLFAVIFRCVNALALSLTPSISSNERVSIKGLLWRGGGGFKEQMKMNLYAHSMKKNCLIFQTTERVSSNKLVGSC